MKQLKLPDYQPGTLELQEARAFWASRPELDHIHATARARLVGPWAVLGNVLMRAIAATGAGLHLPPLVGAAASLNTFVGVVAGSGGGKGTSTGAAISGIEFHNAGGFTVDTPVFPLGSGEGIARTFMPPTGEDEQPITRAIFDVAEVDTLTQLAGRSGATVTSELRKAWSGESLGFANASADTKTRVPAHTYRLCLLVGIQPGRAAGLLNGTDGGMPQRFLWMPANDPGAALSTPPEAPGMHTVHLESFDPAAGHTMAVPQKVRDKVSRARMDSLTSPLSSTSIGSHDDLCRLKVAGALAILNGRIDMNMDDWELSRIVMQISHDTREQVREIVNATETREQEKRIDQRNQAMESADSSGAARHVSRLITKGHITSEKRMTESEIRRRARSNYRDHIPTALADACRTGVLTKTVITEEGVKTNYYAKA